MIIETDRLILRPIVETDAEDIYEYSQNPDVGIHAGWKPHESLKETKEIMPEIFLDKPHIFGMVLKENHKLVGTVGLLPDPKRKNPQVLMLGYALGKDWWGRGLMTEAAKAVIGYGFNEVKLSAISSCCYPYNKRSSNVMKKCGFLYEGTLKQCDVRYDGKVLDSECYLLTKEQAKM